MQTTTGARVRAAVGKCRTPYGRRRDFSHEEVDNQLLCNEDVALAMGLALKAHIVDFLDAPDSNSSEMAPSLCEIHTFVLTTIEKASLHPYHVIIALIFMERIMDSARELLSPTNWSVAFLSCTLVATKAYDDDLTFNEDFLDIAPDITLNELKNLEAGILTLMSWTTYICGPQYGQYYFALRDFLREKNTLAFLDISDRQYLFSLEENLADGDGNVRAKRILSMADPWPPLKVKQGKSSVEGASCSDDGCFDDTQASFKSAASTARGDSPPQRLVTLHTHFEDMSGEVKGKWWHKLMQPYSGAKKYGGMN